MSEPIQPWPTLPLRQLASEMCLGKMLDKQKNRGSFRPYLRNVNVRWFSFDLDDLKEMRFESGEERRFGLRHGDLVICEGGEPGRAAVWKGHTETALIQKALHRVRFNADEYEPLFAAYYLYFGTITNLFAPYYTGTTIKHLTGKALSQVEFPVPTLNEQRRIVAKIEELFSELDAGVAALERAAAKLKRYRASVLKAAVDGSLTADWRAAHPNAEPASELLQRILAERRKRWEADQLAKFAAKGKQLPKDWQAKYVAPEHAEIAQLSELPIGWHWATLDQLCDIGTGTTPSRSNSVFYDGGKIPWILSTAVNLEYVDHAREFVTEKALARTTLRLYPVGTLIVALYGEGKTRGMVSELRIAATINQALAALVFEDSAEEIQPYIKYFLLSGYIALRRKAAGGMQPNLNLGLLKATAIALPPRDEQRVVIAILAEKLSEISAAETAINHGLRRAARLRQSILKQAFAGRLVPQDPNDEPAAVLLERISASRVAHEPRAKAAKPKRKATRA